MFGVRVSLQRRLGLVVSVALGAAIATPALASPDLTEIPKDERERIARIADEGSRLLEAGDLDGALRKFEEAEGALPVATLSLQRGIILERLGRLVEAKKAFERAAGIEVDAKTPWQHSEAKLKAAEQLGRITPLVPSVRILLKGGSGARRVELDGKPIGVSGDSLALDPGTHLLTGLDPEGATARAEFSLVVGETKEVTLEFDDPAAARARVVWTIAGIGSLSLAGVSVAVGLGTGIAWVSLQSDVEARCPGGGCANTRADEDQAGVFLGVAIGSAVLGAVTSAFGTVAIVLGTDTEGASTATLRLSPLGVGASWSF
jgi:hypothetical protein